MKKEEQKFENNTTNRKFYVYEDENDELNVFKILFDFLKKDYPYDKKKKISNLERLKQEIEDRTIDPTTKIAKNQVNTAHPKSYFDTINKKIEKVEMVIKKNDFTELNNDDKVALAEFLYQLEDLAEDKCISPEHYNNSYRNGFDMKDVINQFHIIKTLTLPVLENCTYHYDDKDSKTVKINLVQDFNFLTKTKSLYRFYNFYPFNDKQKFKEEKDAVKWHYKIMAKNYFLYLQDLIDKNPNKFFICYKPGVGAFAAHKTNDTKQIYDIFFEEFKKLDDEYKYKMLFHISNTPINVDTGNGYKYNYTIEKLKEMFPNNNVLNELKDKDICYINGVARDPWAKIGDEGRTKANHSKSSNGTTDAKFVRDSNEVEILYGVNINTGKPTNDLNMNNLTAQPAEIYIKKGIEMQQEYEEKYYNQFINNMLQTKKVETNEILSKENKDTITLEQGNEMELKQYIRNNYHHKGAYFIYNEEERKNNALVEYGNGNITNLNTLNNIIRNIHGKKCSWCCGNY